MAYKIRELYQRNKKWTHAAFAALFVLFPLIIRNTYILHILILLGIYLTLGMSLNVVTGVTGELDLGHAAFFGIGAYVSSLFALKLTGSFWIGLPLSAVVSMAFGFLLGFPSLRIRGDYLAIVTLGFNEIIRYILLNWQQLTNGPMGIRGIPSPSIFGHVVSTKQVWFYIVGILVFITYVVMGRISCSRFGRALVAIRENEIAATSLGINTGFYKVWGFSITAAFAGMAGSFFAHYMNFINPNNFTSNESILILCMVVIGGKGSLIGSILGVSALLLLPELLRPIESYRMLIYGILLIVMMIYRPKGFIPERRVPQKIC